MFSGFPLAWKELSRFQIVSESLDRDEEAKRCLRSSNASRHTEPRKEDSRILTVKTFSHTVSYYQGDKPSLHDNIKELLLLPTKPPWAG